MTLDCAIQDFWMCNPDSWIMCGYVWIIWITLDYAIQIISVMPINFEQFILVPLWHKKMVPFVLTLERAVSGPVSPSRNVLHLFSKA